jgi:histidinol-phosphate aminotransferase
VKLGPSTGKDPFSLNKAEVIRAASRKGVKVLVLASPNNPTGIQYAEEEIMEIAEALPQVAIIIDEAYVEYARYSASKFFSKKPNLILARTFSKAFGLANLRLGYLLSSDFAFVEKFNNDVQYPYPVAGFSVLMATELLRRKAMVLEYAENTKTYRRELSEGLQRLGLSVVTRSDANFVLVKSRSSRKIAEELSQKYAIAVKYIPKLSAESEFLRITVGSREINEKLLYSLRRIITT